jgi:hypothetical protein
LQALNFQCMSSCSHLWGLDPFLIVAVSLLRWSNSSCCGFHLFVKPKPHLIMASGDSLLKSSLLRCQKKVFRLIIELFWPSFGQMFRFRSADFPWLSEFPSWVSVAGRGGAQESEDRWWKTATAGEGPVEIHGFT